MAPRHLSSLLRGLESWLKVQVASHLGQFWVKADQRPTALTAGEMECSSKVHPLPMPFQGSHHLLFLLQMEMAHGQEPFKSSDHPLTRQLVTPTQHPLQLQGHRDGHKTARTGINANCRTSTLVSSATGRVMAARTAQDPSAPGSVVAPHNQHSRSTCGQNGFCVDAAEPGGAHRPPGSTPAGLQAQALKAHATGPESPTAPSTTGSEQHPSHVSTANALPA
jgi:hypothetical protein